MVLCVVLLIEMWTIGHTHRTKWKKHVDFHVSWTEKYRIEIYFFLLHKEEGNLILSL